MFKVLDSQSRGLWVQNRWVGPKSTQPFFLLRSTKWAPGSPRDQVLKSKLSPHNVALRKLNPIHKKGLQFFLKSKSFKLNMTDWPCHVWLQKISMIHQQDRLWGVLLTFMHKFGWWDFVYFITKPYVYQQWTMYALKPKSVLEMHFCANSKKTQSLEKNSCRQKCLDKSLTWWHQWTIFISINYRLSQQQQK